MLLRGSVLSSVQLLSACFQHLSEQAQDELSTAKKKMCGDEAFTKQRTIQIPAGVPLLRITALLFGPPVSYSAAQHTPVLPPIPSGPCSFSSPFFSVSLVVKRSVCSLVEGVTTSCQCRCVMAGLFCHPFLRRPTERCKVVKASPLLHMKVRKQKAAAEGAARVHVWLSVRVKSEF